MSANATKPVAFIEASTENWLQTIGDMVDAKMQMTFRTEVLGDYKVPIFLASLDNQVLLAEIALLKMQLHTSEGNGRQFWIDREKRTNERDVLATLLRDISGEMQADDQLKERILETLWRYCRQDQLEKIL